VKGTKGTLVLVDATKAYSRSRGRTPLIPNLATRWRWVVNFVILLLSLRVRSPVPSEKKPGWSKEPVWTLGELKKLFLLPVFETQMVQPLA
jgi:hypothetical protein